MDTIVTDEPFRQDAKWSFRKPMPRMRTPSLTLSPSSSSSNSTPHSSEPPQAGQPQLSRTPSPSVLSIPPPEGSDEGEPMSLSDLPVPDGVNTFVPSHPPTLSTYDEICNITLSMVLHSWFDNYKFGLRIVALDEYECHVFPLPDWPQHWRYTIHGAGEDMPGYLPSLHGYRISPPQPQDPRNPPPGVIRWHYLQCVIRKFAHSDYKNIQNIDYCELSLPMEEDPDNQDTDSEFEWPSAGLDRGRAMRAAIEDHEECQRFVAEWATEDPS